MTALLSVAGLCVSVRNAAGVAVDIVHDVSFSAERGETVALIGESGSGKTTTALALLGYAKPGCTIRAGTINVAGVDVRALSPAALPGFRGRRAAYVAQSAAASFNPAQRLIRQVTETAVIGGMPVRAARDKAVALFAELALPDPATIGDRFPHQVSGGQLQRLMAAMALMTDPELVILDEPTTALDVTTQVEVLRAFRRVTRERGTTAVYVSHDLAVVAQMADRILVLRNGAVQEDARTATLLSAPQHAYTRLLLDAAPSAHAVTAPPVPRPMAAPILEVDRVSASYGGPRGVPAVRDVSFQLLPGAVLGLIGESGSGKSSVARVLTGILPAHAGTLRLRGETLAPGLAGRSRAQLRRMQIVFQMADTALNPGHSIGRILGRPLQFYGGLDRAGRTRRVAELLDLVRLPASVAGRSADELSGGQKQRVNLARALAAEPEVLICDEVTSALDTVVGVAVLDLLAELRARLGLAMVFISHDLATVRSMADDIAIMYAGSVVQLAGRAATASGIGHPYAGLLAASVPELRTGWLDGLPPLADAVPPRGGATGDGCSFFSRCVLRVPGLCDAGPPPVQVLSNGAAIRCVRDEAVLRGTAAAALVPA